MNLTNESYHLVWKKKYIKINSFHSLFKLFVAIFSFSRSLLVHSMHALKLISLVINVSSLTTNGGVKIYVHSSDVRWWNQVPLQSHDATVHLNLSRKKKWIENRISLTCITFVSILVLLRFWKERIKRKRRNWMNVNWKCGGNCVV